MQQAARNLEGVGYNTFSVRSSAIEEDTGLSFAGQYRSFLQVPSVRLGDRYKAVVASLFSPEAMAYRREHHIGRDDSAMAVGVLAMVDPTVSGVMYSRDPEAADEDVVLISAAWGLARTVVEGRSGSDFYRVKRPATLGTVLEERIAAKTRRLVPDDELGEAR